MADRLVDAARASFISDARRFSCGIAASIAESPAVLNKEAVPELGDTPIRQPEIEAPEPVITDDEYDRHRFDHEPASTKH